MIPFAYYNEIDPYCVQWLRNLIEAGLIPDGIVDDRSIAEVQPDDLDIFDQCHFFAGLGGWAYAARLAGWPDGRKLWTGSCPCQPWSTAGKGEGASDARHLWPEWFRLIRAARPAIVVGEQVPGAVGKGWLDGVADDMEGEGYAFRAAIVPAVALGAPHRRDRVWFVGDSGIETGWRDTRAIHRQENQERREGREDGNLLERLGTPGAGGGARTVADTDEQGLALGQGIGSDACEERTPAEREGWWLVEPDVGRVAHGVRARVAKLRALGNAIVPQVAAEVLGAYMDCRP